MHFRGRCKSGHADSETGGHAHSEMTGHLPEMGGHAGLKYAVLPFSLSTFWPIGPIKIAENSLIGVFRFVRPVLVGAASFDAILNKVKAKYVLGLTATPIRRDGQQPIIFMQCGPIRYTASSAENAPHDLEVLPRLQQSRINLPADASISEVFGCLVKDVHRTKAIAMEVRQAYEQGRKILVLTERTEHLDVILTALDGQVPAPFVLHGKMSKKQRAITITQLNALPPESPRILLATGKLVGEGFDHPALDTLVLTMPISWKGALQQYAGRLHREHTNKTNVRIIDFVDTGHPALLRMWDKRQSGYRAMGYRITKDPCIK